MAYNEIVAVIKGEAVAGRAAEVKKALEEKLHLVSSSTLDVAELLSEVRREGFYTHWGFNTFQEYVEQLDIKLRKAQYLVRIVDVMNELNIPRNQFEEVGIAKLREITSLDLDESYTDDSGNTGAIRELVPKLLKEAPQTPLADIKETVKKAKGLVGEDEIVWLNIAVKRQVRDDVIKPAIDLARENVGSVGKDADGLAVDISEGRALEYICADFISGPGNNPLDKQ